ncbi:MAG TPA: acyl-CoA ligase (AMP-forming), exosortase A system-associated [Steroidobacteraceae bacterium]|nr:acyl-CoA ligase (AMP-forming), exosortase A system-associated [Steroidobacteraceae bacterium]
MSQLLFELALHSAERAPATPSLSYKDRVLDYAALATGIENCARGLVRIGLKRLDRVGVYLPKQPETVIAMFAAARAGCVFVPINPLLKAAQVAYILRDCNVRVLITSPERAAAVGASLGECDDLATIVMVGASQPPDCGLPSRLDCITWDAMLGSGTGMTGHRVIDTDVVSIFYTSGSTGKPKGVVLSHRNMVAGAESVAQYLGNVADDRLLAVLPFSFDYGFSQLSTAFHAGASVILMDYLLPRDVIALAARERATALAGVPPLWSQLADLEWPAEARASLRYITNSGGAMPLAVLRKLRAALPNTQPFLMYGLTEAFRSTFLPPAELDRRPDSIGKAIPNAEILVVRPDGTLCGPDEPGELVHRGALVSLGYWNDPVKTAERFKPVPSHNPALVLEELAVWSGDTVRADEEGFLYFVGRRDEMIKTSGYRVSPTEVEEVVFATGLVADAAAVGVPHPRLGQGIVVVATPAPNQEANADRLLAACREQLPQFMVPLSIEWREALPRNANGKYDRPRLAAELRELFTGASTRA